MATSGSGLLYAGILTGCPALGCQPGGMTRASASRVKIGRDDVGRVLSSFSPAIRQRVQHGNRPGARRSARIRRQSCDKAADRSINLEKGGAGSGTKTAEFAGDWAGVIVDMVRVRDRDGRARRHEHRMNIALKTAACTASYRMMAECGVQSTLTEAGDRKGDCSIRLNDQFRLTFQIEKKPDVNRIADIAIEDSH